MSFNKNQSVEVQMLIRQPAARVFEAFINPEVTTNFWFTKSTGPLKEGRTVTWSWEMYGASADVKVKKIIADKKITIEWDDPVTTVDFEFTKVTDESTYVVIRHYGFDLEGDDLINAIKDSTGGFTTVLDGLKAYLEHGIRLNLVPDKFPKEVTGQR